jgi:hypothetical protein
MTEWLDCRTERRVPLLPDPFTPEWSHADRDRTIESVVLALLRNRLSGKSILPEEKVLERWVSSNSPLGRLVDEVRTAVSSGRPDRLAFLGEADPGLVALAWRAGIRPGFPAGLSKEKAVYPGYWAVFALSPLSTDGIEWLGGLSREFQSVVGLGRRDDAARIGDFTLVERLEPFRAALRPAPD